ncbi:MAG: FAD binding domain-containing protein [Acidimicrobiaceae bacterium]|nr:FAD binding domain-containing protein [Acidimicrobiaceae bacterium]
MTTAVQAYRRPGDLAAALELLAAEGSLPLAGGTDFVPMQRSGSINPATIVDLKSVPELRRVEVRDEHVIVGGCVTMAGIGALRAAGVGALTDGADYVGGRQTRARATLGGNVARSSPAGDTLAPLLALDATVRIAGAGHGDRELPLRSFFVGPGQNRLEPGEIITEIVVPSAGSSAYLRLTYRSWMDLAVSGVAVWIRPDGAGAAEARVALCGVGPTPLLVPAAGAALAGSEPDIEEASRALESAAQPVDDVRGTAEYRLASLRPLLSRALATAMSRSREESP